MLKHNDYGESTDLNLRIVYAAKKVVYAAKKVVAPDLTYLNRNKNINMRALLSTPMYFDSTPLSYGINYLNIQECLC